jgi:hypothetical protein
MAREFKGKAADMHAEETAVAEDRRDTRQRSGPPLGGSFAPPLDKDKIAAYRKLACPHQSVADAIKQLCDMVELFQQTPRSMQPSTKHQSGVGTITPLSLDEVERIWDAVPWEHEIEGMRQLFDKIDPVADKAVRNAAFHLLWFAIELNKDREPLTNDML